MTTPIINTICLKVKAYSESEALEIAKEANENICNGKMSCFVLERLTPNGWLAVLAYDKDEALQAQENFHNPQDV